MSSRTLSNSSRTGSDSKANPDRSKYIIQPNKQEFLDTVKNLKNNFDKPYFVTEEQHEMGGLNYDLIVISTENRDGEMKVAAVAMFQAGVLLAYPFTTNDPVDCDDFDLQKLTQKFQPVQDISKFLKLLSVEQVVFCEYKVRLAQKCLESLVPTTNNPTPVKNLAMASKSEELLKLLVEGLKMLPNIAGRKVKGDLTKEMVEAAKDASIAGYKQILSSMDEGTIALNYAAFLDASLELDSTIHPSEFKRVGRNVLLTPEFIKLWDKLAFMALLMARIWFMMMNPYAATMMVLMKDAFIHEISKDDNLYALCLSAMNEKGFPCEPKVDLSAAVKEMPKKLIAKVLEANATQAAYISDLSVMIEQGEIDKAFEHLAQRNVPGKLGMALKVAVELVTKSLTFPEALLEKINIAFVDAGIPFSFFLPEEIDLSLIQGLPIREIFRAMSKNSHSELH